MYAQAGTVLGGVSMATGMGYFGQSWGAVIAVASTAITFAMLKSWRRSERDAEMAGLR